MIIISILADLVGCCLNYVPIFRHAPTKSAKMDIIIIVHCHKIGRDVFDNTPLVQRESHIPSAMLIISYVKISANSRPFPLSPQL